MPTCREGRQGRREERSCPRRSTRGDEGQEDDQLQQLDGEDGEHLRGDELAASQRRGAETLQNHVAALEPGGDAEADHGGGHDREGDHAGQEEVGGFLRTGGEHVDEREEGEQQHGDDERQEQLLAVAQHEHDLGPQLRHDALHAAPPVTRL